MDPTAKECRTTGSVAIPLRKGFSWALAGNVIYAASQWVILVALTKLGNAQMVGQFTLGLAITAPIMMLTNLQLRAIQASDVKGEFSFRDYLITRAATSGIALGITGLVLVVGSYSMDVALAVFLVAMTKVVESFSDVFYGLFQLHGRMDLIGGSMIRRGVLSALALTLAVAVTGRLAWGVIAMLLSWSTVVITFDVKKATDVLKPAWRGRQYSVQTAAKLVRVGLPLGLTMMLGSLQTNIPRYVIEDNLGQHELGIFAALAYLMVPGNTIIGALGQSASPQLVRLFAAEKTREFAVLIGKLLGVAVFLGVSGVLVALFGGRQLLSIMYAPEYAEYTPVFVNLMAAAGVGYVAALLGYAMTSARRFRVQLPLLLMVVATTGVVAMRLVPSSGMMGGAAAVAAGYLVQAAGSVGIIAHALKKPSLRD